MLRIRDISLCPGEGTVQLLRAAAKQLGCSQKEILQMRVVKKSIDARKKNDVRVIYTVDVSIRGEDKRKFGKNSKISRAVYKPYHPPKPVREPSLRPVIVGFGPAGMFAALILAEAGLCPIVLERGYDAETRHKLVRTFWESGSLDTKCNVQFGEGGAGTFSDGKLNTGVNDERIAYILQRFVDFGAQESILWDAKPHIGTDVLLTVVQNLRKRVTDCGGEVRFGATVTDLITENGALTGVIYEQNGESHRLESDAVILAPGHSARDTFNMLLERGIPMERKAFSMGVRIEHLQKNISASQYGEFAPLLPAADYKLNCRLPDGSSAYTFCMCPGGYVVAAASEEGGVVTNGMSYSDRSGENANSALLVTLQPDDFPYSGVLGGVEWQRELERKAYEAGGSNYHAPAQLVGDFLQGKPSTKLGDVQPTYRPGIKLCDLADILPEKIVTTLRGAIPVLDRYLHGFASPDAVLTAPETRSSSPVRILRDADFVSELRGLYPCGEGAGYAGGITSAAVDGIRCAEAVINSLK